jgi:ABC-type dipeptide/oligopeptide/nickel transport system ATPase component
LLLKRFLPWLVGKPQTYALVGKSGTGKSFKARVVAQRYGIDLIIDDGLLIRGQKIIAGRSAKKEKAILGAIPIALFTKPDQIADVKRVLAAESYRRILVIGTSVRMIQRIANTLGLPPITRIIFIEEVSKRQEIDRALEVRAKQGKHIIPVPAVEIKRNYPHIFFESVKILLKGNPRRLAKKDLVVEKTVVRPEYGRTLHQRAK